MSSRYRATVNVQAPLTMDRPGSLTEWVTQVHATMAAKVDAHMILERSQWNPTGTVGLYVLTFTYQAGHDAEALSIVHDAAKVAGASYDAVRVTTNAGRRQVEVPA